MARRIFSTLFSLIFIPICLIALLLLGLKFSLLSPGFYKKSLRQAQVYTRIVENIGPAVPALFGEEISFAPLTSEDLGRVFQDSVSPRWLETQVENTIDGFFSYASGKSTSLEATISLVDVKSSMATNLASALNEKWANLPECTPAQLEQLQGKEEEAILSAGCMPPGIDVPQITEELFTGESGFLSGIPDQLDLSEMVTKDSLESSSLVELPRYYNYFRLGLLGALGVSLLLMLFVALMNRKNFSQMLRWLAVPLLIAALPVLAIAVLIGQLVPGLLEDAFLTEMSAELRPFVSGLIGSFLGNFSLRVMTPAGIAFVLSIVGLIAAAMIARRSPATASSA